MACEVRGRALQGSSLSQTRTSQMMWATQGRHLGDAVAQTVLESLENAPNVELITRYFKWNLIEADPDDIPYTVKFCA